MDKKINKSVSNRIDARLHNGSPASVCGRGNAAARVTMLKKEEEARLRYKPASITPRKILGGTNITHLLSEGNRWRWRDVLYWYS